MKIRATALLLSVLLVVVGRARAQDHDEAALMLLDRVVETYQLAPALVDEVSAKMTTPLGSLDFDFTIALGSDGTARAELRRDTRFTVVDQTVYITRRYAAGKYTRAAIQPNLVDGLARVMGGRHNVPVHFFLRDGAKPEAFLERLTLRALQAPVFDRVDEITRDDRTLARITISATNGSATLTVDPETHLLVSYEMFGSIAMGGPQPAPVSALFEYRPRVLHDLPEPITFDPGDLQQVRNLNALVPEVGDLAPPIKLATADGTEIDTADFSGDVIVLDFWASWCGPCKVGLPLTDTFARSLGEDSDVRVLAINVMENGTLEDIAAMAKRYWDRVEFVFPTLLDVTSSTVRDYAAEPPTTVVIGRDGRIVARIDRHREDKVQFLQDAVAQARATGRELEQDEDGGR